MTQNSGPAHRGWVVVATDGRPEGTRAVMVAADEAARRQTVLLIVHIVPAYVYPVVENELSSLEQHGQDLLHSAKDAVLEAHPSLRVSVALVAGNRVSSIVDQAEGAALTVLAARPLSQAARIWTGSTSAGVVARTDSPVLVLPGDHEAHRDPTGRITVGVQSTQGARAVLEAGFAEAEAAGARLHVVHAWRLAGGYDDIIGGRGHGTEWAEQMAGDLSEQLAPLREAHPEVETDVEVVHGQAARVLVDASAGCDRLVVSKPTHGALLHHLGGTARALLRDATCPVLIVPAAAPAPGDPA